MGLSGRRHSGRGHGRRAEAAQRIYECALKVATFFTALVSVTVHCVKIHKLDCYHNRVIISFILKELHSIIFNIFALN